MRRGRILGPSDLGEQPKPKLLVGGRVVHTKASEMVLADAFAQVRVRLREKQKLDAGDLVVVRGRWQARTLRDAELLERYPHPPPGGDGEFARLSWQAAGERLKARSQALKAIRSYFEREGFVEVDTPLRVPAPGVDLHLDAIRAQGGWLITSPEFHMKRLVVGGMPRIFQLCHASRADEQGTLHEPEFLMLEWYRAFANFESVLIDTEQLVAHVARELTSTTTLRTPSGERIDATPPFERVSVRDAFRKYANIDDAIALAAENEDQFFELLVGHVEPSLARHKRPVFLCEYPISQAALARPSPDNPHVAERFELYAGGVELCNGYGELTDPVEQRVRIQADRRTRKRTRRPVYPIDERFLAALAEGMPPCAGNALGVDRLLMLVLGAKQIADVQAFPSARI